MKFSINYAKNQQGFIYPLLLKGCIEMIFKDFFKKSEIKPNVSLIHEAGKVADLSYLKSVMHASDERIAHDFAINRHKAEQHIIESHNQSESHVKTILNENEIDDAETDSLDNKSVNISIGNQASTKPTGKAIGKVLDITEYNQKKKF